MKNHKHRAMPGKSRESGFQCQVAWPGNPAAHGCITVWDYCSCGAVRATNVNQSHIERGQWEGGR